MSRKRWAAGISGVMLAVAGYLTQTGQTQDISVTNNANTNPANTANTPQVPVLPTASDPSLASPFAICSADIRNTNIPVCPPTSSRTDLQQAEIDDLKASASFNLKEAQDSNKEATARFYSYITTLSMLDKLNKAGATDTDLTQDIRDQKAITAQFVSLGNQILDDSRRDIGQPPASEAQARERARLMSNLFDMINKMQAYAGIDSDDSYRRLGLANADAFGDAVTANSLYRPSNSLRP